MTDNATPMPGTAERLEAAMFEMNAATSAVLRDLKEAREAKDIAVAFNWGLERRLEKFERTTPALLSALEKALNAAEVFVDGGDLVALPAFEEWLPEARAAIASART